MSAGEAKTSARRQRRADLVNKIEDGLFLGDLVAASDADFLADRGINAVLTVETCPIPPRVARALKDYKFVAVCDTDKDNLLSHFEDCVAFIDEAKKTGNVLVHCYFGISRSCTVVVAYLMAKHQLSADEALQRVATCRPCVSPNQGFLAQLRLFQEMGCRVQLSNLRYKIFAMSMAAGILKRERRIPNFLASMIKPDPMEVHLPPGDGASGPKYLYRCASCRRVLATEDNVIPHLRGLEYLWTDLRLNDLTDAKALVCPNGIFFEPLAWMKNAFSNLQGKLHCPGCNSKLGSFTWLLGVSCSCSTRITPAFHVQQKKVDKMARTRVQPPVSDLASTLGAVQLDATSELGTEEEEGSNGGGDESSGLRVGGKCARTEEEQNGCDGKGDGT